MAGKSVRKGLGKVITARVEELDELGERGVWDLYFEHGSATKMVAALWDPHGGGKKTGTGAFYAWLDEDDTGRRWDEWRKVQRYKSYDHMEEAERLSADITPENAHARKTAIDAHLRLAGAQNKREYGKADVNVNVTHDVGASLALALQQLEAHRADDPQSLPIEEKNVLEGEYELVDE